MHLSKKITIKNKSGGNRLRFKIRKTKESTKDLKNLSFFGKLKWEWKFFIRMIKWLLKTYKTSK